ncbi:MAG: HD domain-containing protein [Chloroflexi bacterium]|nr:HD domain-containing protein [Chloroflexota bacterium]
MAQAGSDQQLAQGLQEEINGYVAEIFDGFIPRIQDDPTRKDGKVIRDPIHGFFQLTPAEVEVIDTPLIQRLRYIHQNAFAYLVYPSAHHTRFEHSLGAAKVVADIAQGFRQRGDDSKYFPPEVEAEARLAALLHDVGHGIFSHLSESLIKEHWFDLFETIKPLYNNKSPGEILSHMLTMSPLFQRFLREVFDRHHLTFSPLRVANLIIGQTDEPSANIYRADLITGPLDADKLDYIARDSYFTGIRTECDVSNIVRCLRVWSDSSHPIGRTMVVTLSGSSFAEQMHFARLLLFPAMYHHQKVRALESMVKGLFENIWDNNVAVEEPRLQFKRITDFFRITEGEFLALATREPITQNQARRLSNRMLLQRALHISSSVVLGDKKDTLYSKLVDLGLGHREAAQEIRTVREECLRLLPDNARHERGTVGQPLDVYDIHLDIPRSPELSSDLMRCYVATGENEPVPLTKLFPLDGWLGSYAENKWTGHVYGYPDYSHLQALNKVSRDVLQTRFGIRFNDRASKECKLPA